MIKITALTENTTRHERLGVEHGLSLFVETDSHRAVFDFGASGLFAENAEKLGIDISAADIAVLSHGHYDHAGGLAAFLDANASAPVYLHALAFGGYHGRRAQTGEIRYIGIDPELAGSPRLRFNPGTTVIDGELTLFSDVHGRELFSETNDSLLESDGQGGYMPDRFRHEQNLVITGRSGRRILICGCAHNGIVNILTRYAEIFGGEPDAVIGGFHLSRPGSGSDACSAMTAGVAARLAAAGCAFYTCHCTGMPAFDRLRQSLGNRLEYLAAGDVLEFDF